VTSPELKLSFVTYGFGL